MQMPRPRKLLEHKGRLEADYRRQHGLRSNAQVPESAGFVPADCLYCFRPTCPFVWKIPPGQTTADSGNPLKLCNRCKWAWYCSVSFFSSFNLFISGIKTSDSQVECQRSDWSRHKRECRPIEDIVKDDDLWTSNGSLREM